MHSFSLDKATEILENEGREAQLAYCMQYADGDQKDPDALACLGQFYHNAEKPERDLDKAEAYYREAALAGSELGQMGIFAMACQYMNCETPQTSNYVFQDVNIALNNDKARELLEFYDQLENATFSEDVPKLFVLLADHYNSGSDGIKKNHKKAFACYKYASEKNYAPAMIKLAEFTRDRRRILPEYASAAHWAFFVSVLVLLLGKLVKENFGVIGVENAAWLTGILTASRLISLAAFLVFVVDMFVSGIRTSRLTMFLLPCFLFALVAEVVININSELLPDACLWIKDVSHSVSSVSFFIFCSMGICIFWINIWQSYKWLTKAAATGDPQGMYQLGYYLLNDGDVFESADKAVALYREASSKGCTTAQIELGHLYRFGKKVEKDFDQAFRLYMEAADSGDCDGQFMVGYCYEKGIGALQNLEKADDWYRLGRMNGSELAKERLDRPMRLSLLDRLRGNVFASEKLRIELDYTKKELAAEQESNRQLLNKVLTIVESTHSDVGELKDGQVRIAADVGEIRQDVGETKQEVGDIRDGIGEIKQSLGELSARLETANQELKNAVKENSEALLDKFSEYCKIAQAATIEKATTSEDYRKQAEHILKGKFGDTWGKLDKESQISLISARTLLAMLKGNQPKGAFDYSGIAICASSALENELIKHFFNEFIRVLRKERIPEYKWPKKLIEKKKDFTLGDFSYLIDNYKEESDGIESRNKCLKEILASNHFHSDQPNRDLVRPLSGQSKSFVKQCDYIRSEYRNPSAHAETVDEAKALSCCKWIMGRYDAEEKLNSTESVLILLFELLK